MSAGNQSSDSSSSSATFVNPAQAPFLQGLWSSASSLINPNREAAAAQGAGQRGASSVAGGMNILNGLIRNPLQGQTGVVSNLTRLGNLDQATAASQPALDTLKGLMNPAGQIKAQSASLKSGLGSLFAEELNPAIKGSAIAAGGFGGGRQGVAQGQAVGQLADAYTQGLGDITANANAQAASAAQGYGGLIDSIRSGTLSATGALSDVMGNARSSVLDAISQMPGLGQAFQQFGTAGNTARTQALQALAAIYGNPNVLARSQSGSDSSGWQFGFGS